MKKAKSLPDKLADCKDAEEGERWIAEHVDDHLEADIDKPVPAWAQKVVDSATHRGSTLESLFEELGELEEFRELAEKKRLAYLETLKNKKSNE